MTSLYLVGTDALVGDAVESHASAIADKQRQLNQMRAMTAGAARVLLLSGQAAIDEATREAARTRGVKWWGYLHPYAYAVERLRVGFPPPSREGSLSKVYWKLRWHQDEIDKLKPDAPYPHADDLKRWVIQAFIEENVSEEEGDFLDRLWADMWKEILERFGNTLTLPFRIPAWAWWTGGAVVAGVVGLGLYKRVAGR